LIKTIIAAFTSTVLLLALYTAALVLGVVVMGEGGIVGFWLIWAFYIILPVTVLAAGLALLSPSNPRATRRRGPSTTKS